MAPVFHAKLYDGFKLTGIRMHPIVMETSCKNRRRLTSIDIN